MPYVDLATIHDPTTGSVPTVAWGDQIRTNFEYVVDPPRCSVSGDATTCANSSTVWTTLDADTEFYDTDGIHSGASDALVIVTPGTYEVGLRVRWDHADTAFTTRAIAINKNAASRSELGRAMAVTDGGNLMFAMTHKAYIAGDSIVCEGLSDGENADATVIEFWVRWIGR